MRKSTRFALLLLALAAPLSAKTDANKSYASALSDPARPVKDAERDSARKPAQLLAFAGIKPGQRVADFIMGGGYLTRILSSAVGPKGVVYGYQPAEFIAYRAAYGTEQDTVAIAHANVKPLRPSLSAFELPEQVDVIITVQNFHDLYLKPMPAGTAEKAKAALFKALKPGGTLIVVDHVAKAGSGFEAADTLHRIDPALARRELEKAGFRFERATPIWRSKADPLTDNVFSPSIRGKTDQFAFRFRKPK